MTHMHLPFAVLLVVSHVCAFPLNAQWPPHSPQHLASFLSSGMLVSEPIHQFLLNNEHVQSTLIHETVAFSDDPGNSLHDEAHAINGSSPVLALQQTPNLPPFESPHHRHWQLPNCTQVTTSCSNEIVKVNTKMIGPVMDFEKANYDCTVDQASPCWNFTSSRWAQGDCTIRCRAGISEFEQACEKNDGVVCESKFFVGLAGTTLRFHVPTCTPQTCAVKNNDKHLNECIRRHTCEKVNDQLLPECVVESGCFPVDHVAIDVLLYTSFSVLGTAFFLASLVSFGCFNWLKRDRQGSSTTKPLLLRSTSLRESIFSPVMGVVSPTDDHNYEILEGTPLNTTGINNTLAATLWDDDDADSLAETGEEHKQQDQRTHAPPKFRFSKALMAHVRQGMEDMNTNLTEQTSRGAAPAYRGCSLVWRNLYYHKQGVNVLKGVSGYIAPGMVIALIGAPDSGTTTLLKVLARRTVDGSVTGEILLNGTPPNRSLFRKVGYIPKEDLNLACLTVRETLEFSFQLRAKRGTPKQVQDDRIDAALQLLGLSHVAETIVGDGLIVRGISGGERRRVSLGVEAVVNRTILLADSPTNGLDSNAAYDVIKTARAMADTGLMSIMASVRQPSPELLFLFDTCCLLSRGTCIYFGPTAKAISYFETLGFVCPESKSLPDFLEGLTGDASRFLSDQQAQANAHFAEEAAAGTSEQEGEEGTADRSTPKTVGAPPPSSTSAAASAQAQPTSSQQQTGPLAQQQPTGHPPVHADEHYSVGEIQNEIRLKRKPSQLRLDLEKQYRGSAFYKKLGVAIWNEVDIAAANEERREAGAQDSDLWEYLGDEDEEDDDNSTWKRIRNTVWYCFRYDQFETGFFHQLWICLVRQAKIVYRSPTSKSKVGSKVFLGILLGTMFHSLDFSQEAAQNRFGLLFLVASSTMMGELSVIPQLFAQRVMFYHQKSAGYFRAVVYHFCVLLMELPVMLLQIVALSLIVYPLCGLNGGIMSWNFVYFFVTLFVLQVASWSLCMLGVMLSPSVVVASALVPTIMSIMTLFSGYLVPRNALPSTMRWLNDLSVIARPMKGLAINEVDGLVYTCRQDELIPQSTYPGFSLPPPHGFYGYAYQTCPLATGKMSLVLYDYNSGEQDKWVLMAQCFYFIVATNLMLMVVMTVLNYTPDSSDAAVPAAQSRKRELKELRKQLKDARERLVNEEHRRLSNGGHAGDYQRLNGGDDDAGESLELGRAEPNTGKPLGTVEFSNLNYSVYIPNGPCKKPTEKQLLFDVSGYVAPGTICALMGSSGAGKSTLLDVLANKKTGGKETSDVLLINGAPRDNRFARWAGYVEQMDSHLPTITVREAITTSAFLRLPRELSNQEKFKRVEDTIDHLLLRPFEHKFVGIPGASGPLAGVTPEIRKKVTIAVELVFDPPLLFLDEPTTGLDAYSALRVMSTVKDVCQTKAVMCTIHQPSAEVFALFDWMLLLQTGGRVCYFGPVSAMDDYFHGCGYGRCPAGKNPADFALGCSKVNNSSKTVSSTRMILEDRADQEPADIYDGSEWKEEILGKAPRFSMAPGGAQDPPSSSSSSSRKDQVPEYAVNSWTQFKHILFLQFTYLSRDVALLKTRYLTAALFGLIIGTLFYQLQHDQVGAKSRIALVFISLVYMGYTALLTIPKAIDQRAVHFREYGSNMYRLIPYYAAVTVAEIPFMLLQIFAYMVVFYPMTNLRADPYHITLFILGMTLSSVTCYAFSSFVAGMAPNADTATIVNTLLNSVFTLFCGFLLPYKSIPQFWRFAYYLSFYRYPLGFLVSNEMLGVDFECDPPNSLAGGAFPVFVGGNSSDSPPPPYGTGFFSENCTETYLMNNMQEALGNPYCFKWYCPVRTGEDILDRFSFPTTTDDMFATLSVLGILYIAIRIGGLLALKYVQHVTR